jgi:branched-chain amino acid transport system ATP-binding protein
VNSLPALIEDAPSTVSSASLSIDNLVAGYGAMTVLRGVSLVAPVGEVVAVLGTNGAGKTTLLRSVFGQTTIRSGSLAIGGTEVTGWQPNRVARLGVCYVPEGRAIYRALTVRENLDVFAGGRADEMALEHAFELFPVLKDRLRQAAGTLSGGQQQMVALARALVTDNHVILADELSLGLAPRAVRQPGARTGRRGLRGQPWSHLLLRRTVGAAAVT